MGEERLAPSWDVWGVALARVVAQKSKDPSTKVGAVIMRPDNTVASVGYNGFPRGVHDYSHRYEDRRTKYPLVVHAELNAIVTAREPLHNYTMYCTMAPCGECAKAIIQSGITCVVAPKPTEEEKKVRGERWVESHSWAQLMFDEAGVTLHLVGT